MYTKYGNNMYTNVHKYVNHKSGYKVQSHVIVFPSRLYLCIKHDKEGLSLFYCYVAPPVSCIVSHKENNQHKC